MMEIIQIVPYLPPAVCGVGDYALLLANELRHSYNIHTHFIVCDPGYEVTQEKNAFVVSKVPTHSANRLTSILHAAADREVPLLLHYVGYGYQTRGLPLWLLDGLEAWRNASNQHRLITMFHELFAFGPPWRSSFWTSPLQRWLTVRLARLSHSCITNIQRYAQYLEMYLPPNSCQVNVLPVFSNVEESTTRGNHRSNEMVIFGGSRWREPAYANSSKDLIKVCRLLKISKIHDIGPHLSTRYELPIQIEWHGILPAPRVRDIMQNAQVGFFTYPTPFLGKSGIFAAYAAHGLTPVTTNDNDKSNQDKLQLNCHFLTCNALADAPYAINEIGEGVHSWYSEHRLAVQAQQYAAILTGIATT